MQALIREAKEEIGKDFDSQDLTPAGRRLHVGVKKDGTVVNSVSYIFFIQDESDLLSYRMQEEELEGIVECPINSLISLFNKEINSFTASGASPTGDELVITVTEDSFPENWDPYHLKAAIFAQKFLTGETRLIY
ncbi:MAG: NUDIX domain-containing protein [Candidatus Dojkabacteria bacterium]|nr:MAG: NUDIX domain-containing protein [Candidatus Dojkabacteria bacterium]